MAGFTKGPWEIEPSAARGAWIKGVSGEWAAIACGDNDASALANAHLIAAAPALYEALKLYVAIDDRRLANTPILADEFTDLDRAVEIDECLNAARLALSLADGSMGEEK